MEPQRKFDKLIRAYERAESAGYYRVAGAEPCSVVILKQPFGDVPAGSKVPPDHWLHILRYKAPAN